MDVSLLSLEIRNQCCGSGVVFFGPYMIFLIKITLVFPLVAYYDKNALLRKFLYNKLYFLIDLFSIDRKILSVF